MRKSLINIFVLACMLSLMCIGYAAAEDEDVILYIEDGTVFYHDENNDKVLFKKTGIYSVKTGENSTLYYIKKGKAVTGSKNKKIKYSGKLYIVTNNSGKAKLFTGFYNSYYYKSGIKYTSTGVVKGKFVIKGKIAATGKKYTQVVNGKIYSVDKKGNATVIKDTSKKGIYYKRAKAVNGKYYMYKAKYRNGRAEKFKTPVLVYIQSGSYLYKVKYNGLAVKYKNTKKKKKTAVIRSFGYEYVVYNSTGKVKSCKSIKMSRSAFVEKAKSYLGYNESDGSFKKIIDIYNSYTPWARGYKVQYTDEWCATFVSAVAIELGYTNIITPECGCPQQVQYFKDAGNWKEDDDYVPSPGDIIYYDWDDTGTGDCKGNPDHVGIVEKVKNKKITVIEGNKGEAVARRTISVNGRYIRGFGLPCYECE